jgi:aconitate hydratase
MGKSLSYKILESHYEGGRIKRGAEIPLAVDQVLTTDTLGIISFLYFESMNIPRIRTKLAVCYVDHNTIQMGPESANDHLFLKTFASKFGLYFSKPGNGICHQLHVERFGIPGETLIGTDSHTPTAGGLGMLGIGVGGLDVTAVMAGSPFYLIVPEIMLVKLHGKLPQWTSAKDISLEVLRRLGVRGGFGKILEYDGQGVGSLSVPERATIANLGTETGATSSLFPSDPLTREYLQMQGRGAAWRELKADPDAPYDEVMEIDLDQIEPLVAKPHSPGNVVPVKELEGLKIDQIIIGSCTNSSLRDLTTVAHILKSRKIHPGVSVAISPGSRLGLHHLSKTGLLSEIIKSGVRILEPVCGPCIGLGQAPPSGGISLRTFNRNFKGRSGTPDAHVYLVSPETAAASALTGELTDPRKLTISPITSPSDYALEADDMILPPSEHPEGVTIIRGPNIKPLGVFGSMEEGFDVKVLLKLGDDVTTDLIVPAGSKAMPLRSNIPALSEYTFEAADPTFARRAQKEKGGVIVAGENYGQGSSREHAALCPRYLGVRVILAKSFARIHMNNLINFGILPLTITEQGEYEKLDQGDALIFREVRKAVEKKDVLEIENFSKGRRFLAAFNVTRRQRRILLEGGLINFVRRHPGS